MPQGKFYIFWDINRTIITVDDGHPAPAADNDTDPINNSDVILETIQH